MILTGEADGWDIYIRAADGRGDAELFHPMDEVEQAMVTSWSPDGRFILFYDLNHDIWLLDLEDGEVRPFKATPARENSAEFSPDGRWVAYHSDAGGDFHVYVQAFDPSPGSVKPARRVSVESAFMAHWAGDSRRLFHMTTGPRPVLMVAEVTEDEDGNPVPGEPRRLFEATPAGDLYWDVAPSGDRFIMPVAVSSADAAAFRVFSGWTAALNVASRR